MDITSKAAMGVFILGYRKLDACASSHFSRSGIDSAKIAIYAWDRFGRRLVWCTVCGHGCCCIDIPFHWNMASL